MSTKNYISNYDYIRGCSIEEMAEMMTTLSVEIVQNLTGRTIDENSIARNLFLSEEWLKEPVVTGDYLN